LFTNQLLRDYVRLGGAAKATRRSVAQIGKPFELLTAATTATLNAITNELVSKDPIFTQYASQLDALVKSLQAAIGLWR